MTAITDFMVQHPYWAILICTGVLGAIGSVVGAAAGLVMEAVLFRERP